MCAIVNGAQEKVNIFLRVYFKLRELKHTQYIIIRAAYNNLFDILFTTCYFSE